MMTSKLLREAGEALYGPRWQSEIARDLNVSDRTVRRWLSGADNIPPGITIDLWRRSEERAEAIDAVIDRLKTASTP